MNDHGAEDAKERSSLTVEEIGRWMMFTRDSIVVIATDVEPKRLWRFVQNLESPVILPTTELIDGSARVGERAHFILRFFPGSYISSEVMGIREFPRHDRHSRKVLAKLFDPEIRVLPEPQRFFLHMGQDPRVPDSPLFLTNAAQFDQAQHLLIRRLHHWAQEFTAGVLDRRNALDDELLAELITESDNQQLAQWLQGPNLDPDLHPELREHRGPGTDEDVRPDPDAIPARWRIVCADRTELIFDQGESALRMVQTRERPRDLPPRGRVRSFSGVEIGMKSTWTIGDEVFEFTPVVQMHALEVNR